MVGIYKTSSASMVSVEPLATKVATQNRNAESASDKEHVDDDSGDGDCDDGRSTATTDDVATIVNWDKVVCTTHSYPHTITHIRRWSEVTIAREIPL